MKILLTGGHLGPALSLIEALQKDHWIVFVGRKYPLSQEKELSLEFKEITKRKVKFYHLTAGRFTRVVSVRTFLNLLQFPVGLFQTIKILMTERPDVILSFGGYIGLPVSLIGAFFGIKLYIHEQTVHPGLANRISGFFASKIFLTFDESLRFFQSNKVILTGNPVRKNILKIIKKPFVLNKNQPVVYVTGGSLGSHSINIIVEKNLRELLSKYSVIHQTGNVKEYNDYVRINNLRNSLSPNLRSKYIVRDHFFDNELGYVYSLSDLVVGRSGANTVFELILWKKPSILIPLPWSSNSEQLKHALFMKKFGVAQILEQSEEPQKLLGLIEDILGNKDKYISNFKNLSAYYKTDASAIIKKTIESDKK